MTTRQHPDPSPANVRQLWGGARLVPQHGGQWDLPVLPGDACAEGDGGGQTQIHQPLPLPPALPGAFAKVKESQRMSDEGRMDQEEADGIRKRCRVVGFALQAEMNHFHERRVADFKRMMQSYLKQQIVFYQRVSQQLEKTLRMYDNL